MMNKVLFALLFLPLAVSAIDLSSDESRTFDGTHADNSARACENAKSLANSWLNSKNSSALVTITKSQGECRCDRPPPRQAQKFCLSGTPGCRSDGTKIEDVPQPVVCIVDARMVVKNK